MPDLPADIHRITLDRPAVLNSLDRDAAVGLLSALEAASATPAVRVIVITGAGRAFCAGQDLEELATSGTPIAEVVERFNRIVRALRNSPKAVIAAVNGVAAGAGANLALAADFVIASTEAYFVQSFVPIGLVPDSGGTYLLPRLAGPARARELVLLGEKLPAAEAARLGLIYQAVEPGRLAAATEELASKLIASPASAVAAAKHALNASLANTLDAQLELEKELQTAAAETPEYKAAVERFLSKRARKEA